MIPTLKFGRLRGVNFGPFVDEFEIQLDQGPGLWYISGRNLVDPQMGANACGKTHILNAIYWAITGRTMKSRRPGARVEARRGKGTTEVELHYERSGKPFVISRTRKPNALTLNGAPITDTDLLEKFGIKPEVLQYTCMFGQSNPMFLSIGKEEQAALFNDLLDLDVWLQAAERARVAGSTAAAIVETVQKDINEITGRLTGFREARRALVKQSEVFEAETKAKIADLYKEQKTNTAKLKQIDADLKALGEPQDLTALSGHLETLRDKLQHLQGLRDSVYRSWEINTNNLVDTKKQLAQAKDAVCDACGQSLPADVKKRRIIKLGDLIEIYKTDIQSCSDQLKERDTELLILDTKRLTAKRRLDDATTAQGIERPELQQKIIILQIELKTIERDIDHLSRTKNPHDHQAEVLRKRINADKEALAEATKTLNEAEVIASMAKLWQTSAKEIRLSIIDEALEETAAMATKHAERLGLYGWRVELATERQTTAGTTALGFTANLHPPDETEPVAWETYSGGEETRLQLAMSWGLGEVLLVRAGLIPNLEFADEITRGLSSEGISDLLECLADRARETGRTIYLIDHHILDRGNFSGTLMVEKSKTGSHIVEA